jgi:hypothetical protein
MKTILALTALAAATITAHVQEQRRTPPEIITVHPRSPYDVNVWPRESLGVKEWIEYSRPTLSRADSLGIRHYVFANPNPACALGVTMD